MKKLIIISLITVLFIPALLSQVNYFSPEDYKKLKKQERLQYWEELENELTNLQQRRADAIASANQYQTDIAELNRQLENTNANYDATYSEILSILGIESFDPAAIQNKINYFNNKIDNMNRLSDDELWNAKKAVNELIAEYNGYKNSNFNKIPEFVDSFVELDRKIKNLDDNTQAAKPKYYEDSYSVKRGDTLSKISGYSFIYNDVKKWGIIYRANRDQIQDPNIINPNQVLNIPRGLPNSWKVYRGEFLWKIASYPEIYGDGSKWPLIYRANQDQIKNPDLIFPNQVFKIPRD
jgi:nucleoid-associated protein YgaU